MGTFCFPFHYFPQLSIRLTNLMMITRTIIRTIRCLQLGWRRRHERIGDTCAPIGVPFFNSHLNMFFDSHTLSLSLSLPLSLFVRSRMLICIACALVVSSFVCLFVYLSNSSKALRGDGQNKKSSTEKKRKK